MSHALITIIARIPDARVIAARELVESLGNPASPAVAAAFEAVGSEPGGLAIHFASLTALPATGGGGYLVFEFSADGEPDAVIGALAKHLGPHVSGAFDMAEDRGSGTLEAYWKSRVVRVGQGFFSNPGIVFAGTPGLTVVRIRAERGLRLRLRELVEEPSTVFVSALDRLNGVRAQLRNDERFAWALKAEDAEALHGDHTILQALRRIIPAVARLYLWPLAIPPLVVFVVAWAMDFRLGGLGLAVQAAFDVALGTVIVAALAAVLAYLVFRRRENRELPEDLAPDPAAVARIVARENHAAQNHLAAVSVMKPGLLRSLLVRFVFAAIAQLATHLYRPGWLGTLGTIHFARWVTVPGTRDLLFLSNYGGSWESYLEDFITKAHNGLTGVWSNTLGFPRTSNLIQFGARDGDRFKRWARRQMVPTGCWYTAYPDLTTANIRTNAAIRQGLGTILTEEEARRWLALFGSVPRPSSALEVNEIQSLVFGGLGFLRLGGCLGFVLADDREQARGWLHAVRHHVAFGDGRRHIECAIVLALGAGALAKLRVPEEALATFPPAFLEGMSSVSRARIMGDDGASAPSRWLWGGSGTPVDGVLLLYARESAAVLDALRAEMEECLTSRGHRPVIYVPFVEIPDKKKDPASFDKVAKVEPFGFADGISQPVIRGTYKALRGADPIHIVEPGEFILGYPDNRGNLPAGPTLAAIHDPGNLLPIAATTQHGFAQPIVNDARDLGRNGTFLAVRQLEQHPSAFWDYCADAARGIAARFPKWTNVSPEFVGAKLVGRWPDGSSMVRFPYAAGSEEDEEHLMMRTASGAATPQVPAPPPPVAPAQALQAQPAPQRRAKVKVKATTAPSRRVAITPDNDFLFGTEDAQGLRCPFGAHIRRANPRDSFDPGSQEQLSITNRHRILRVGRRYQQPPDAEPGLFFMCLNADLERQFEFVQQTWLQSASFHGLVEERDPLLGMRDAASRPCSDDGFTIPTRESPLRLRGMPEFVRTLGGGYFFVPGRSVLWWLSS